MLNIFSGCSGLTSIYSKWNTPPFIPDFDYNTYQTATLYVPKGSIDAYKNANGWRRFANIVEE